MPVWTRYPWLCGYLVAPAAFHFASNATPFSWAAPLLTGSTAPANILALCWHFHFIRRAAEVVFLNVYHGKGIPDERDSVIEFVYYLVWGLINGCTASCVEAAGEAQGTKLLVATGLALFCVGQVGNFYCHAHLRSLRPDSTDSKWVIPQQFPFSILVAPHYTCELLSWSGYLLAAGFAPPAILILCLSVFILFDCATNRKTKYIKMYKDGVSNSSPSPETRWALIPFVY